ncbi:TPA: DNA polymerase alpha subunit B [Trebouxia sp. C0004]
MVDRLQDKVAKDVVADAAHNSTHRQFQHPFDITNEQVQYLDGRIGDFAAAFEDATGCHPSHPIYAACQEPVLMVGRICCDSEGRLNERSVLLEGSVALSNGMRTKLDLSKLEGFKLFPGQVAVVRGINPSGACIVAHQMYTAVPKPVVQTSLDQMQHFAQATGAKGLSIVVAAGPFSSNEDATYEPLQALLTHCMTQPPDVLVLMGPFVNADHPLVQAGMLEESYEDIFVSQVIDRLDEYLESAGSSSHVVLVPSIRDVHHHPVFPQPPLPPEAVPTRHPQQFTLLRNPGTFACNEVEVGVVTSDVVKYLSGQEVQRGPQGDRLPSFAAHLLGQQSYYPMYPPAPGSLLDCSQASNLQLPVTPDVLLLPSDLNPFAKLVSLPAPPPKGAHTDAYPSSAVQTAGQVVCVNPGRLAKGAGGGTFATFQIAPSAEGRAAALGRAPETNGSLAHSVHLRCKAIITRV